MAGLTIAFLIRLAYVLYIPDQIIWSDEQDYLLLSENLANGSGYVDKWGNDTAYRAVGYPLFIAGLRLLGCHNLICFRVVQVFLSLATIWSLYLLASRVFNRATGVVTIYLAAIYPYFIYMPGTLLATSWFSCLIITGTYLFLESLEHENKRLMLLSGLFFGLAILTVPAGIVLIGAAILWQIVYKRHLSKRFLPLLLIVLALCILPWVYRNYTALGILNLSSNGGYNLWLGNNPDTDIDHPHAVAVPEALRQRLDAARSEKEISDIYASEAIKFIWENPGIFVKRMIKKAVYFWRLDPSPTTRSYVSKNRLVKYTGIVSFATILSAAIIGFFVASSNERVRPKLWMYFALACTAVYSVFIAKVRFRLPLDHFLIIMAAFSTVRLLQKVGFLMRARLHF